MTPKEPSPEFDAFAENYDAGMGNPFKRMAGADPIDFLRSKVDVLTKLCGEHFSPLQMPIRLLDFGCGAGDFLSLISTRHPHWKTRGCDISGAMIDEARKRHPHLETFCVDSPFRITEQFDVITIICVLHHISTEQRSETIRALSTLLRPGGMLAIFEHNPWNPVTSYVVKHTPIDENAVLLNHLESRRLLRDAGLTCLPSVNFMFVPPRLKRLAIVDCFLSRLPLGGQYCAAALRA